MIRFRWREAYPGEAFLRCYDIIEALVPER